MFAFFPPEAQAALERQQMQVESARHDVARLFTEMDSESLLTLRHVLASIASSDEYAPRLASYFEGLAVGLLTLKGICPGCGKNHEEELLKPPAKGDDNLEVVVTTSEDTPTWPVAEDGTFIFSDEEKAQMEEYGLDDAYMQDEKGNHFIGFACTRCVNSDGSPRRLYVSIVDRMLRASDESGCTGCMDKAKWG